MRIAIVGFGNVGSSLAKVWTAANHEVYVGVRSPETSKPNSVGIKPVTVNEAAASANIVALAIPWAAVRDTLDACGNLSGKIIIDCTNPLNKDLSGLEIGTTTSSAEQIAALRPEADVIKAFNTLGAGLLGNTSFPEGNASGFYCGNDTNSKRTVEPLITAAGLDPIDVGPLSNARWLEAIAMLWIDLALHRGFQTNFAFRLMKRKG